MSILERVEHQLLHKHPFVVYRKPNHSKVSGLFGANEKLNIIKDYSESGFVFAPFDSSNEAICFPVLEFEYFDEEIKVPTTENSKPFHSKFTDAIQYENHKNIVSKAILEIQKGRFKKVVISRKEPHEIQNFDAVSVFKNFLAKYHNAFVYLWYHPKIGLWMGASPETLFKMDGTKITTVALAGTKPYHQLSTEAWGTKEIEEQQLVVDYIEDALLNIVDDINVQERQAIKAGNLSHLKSVITGDLRAGIALQEVVSALHPTPAVCGLPKKESKSFILQNEGYDRSFYTGFLGELNFDPQTTAKEKTHLYVNLRCLEFSDEKVNIYVGGGITKDSDPEKEWLETVNKTNTVKSAL